MPITSLSVLGVGQQWPPLCEARRLGSYRKHSAMLKGDHDKVFADVIELLRREKRQELNLIQLGLPARIAKSFCDMVLGEEPGFKAKAVGQPEESDDTAAQEQIEAYVEEMDLVHEVYQACIDMQALGDGVLKVDLAQKADRLFPDINAVTPTVWYPVVAPDDVQKITAHILAWTWEERVQGQTITRLRAEVHEPGMVTTHEGTMTRDSLDGGWVIETLNIVSEQPTGVDDLLVVPIFNFRTTGDCTGRSDFADLAPILQEMEVRLYLIASILDKHSDPKMYGPRSLVEMNPETGEMEAVSTDLVIVESGDTPPGYITWSGQLDAAYKELEWLADQALVIMESSKALFADIQGQVTSGAAMKRLLVAPLMKAARLRNRLDVALTKALKLASLLHATVDSSAVVFGEVDIMWQDGMPNDDLEQVQIHTLAVGAGIESKEDAIRALFGVDGVELAARMKRLEDEQAVSTPQAPRIQLQTFNNGA